MEGASRAPSHFPRAAQAGERPGGPASLRPPWTNEARIREHCTSCGDCIRACPEAILIAGRAGTPVVSFEAGSCIFCGECARACDEAVFGDPSGQPWTAKADLAPSCLLNAGISCQTCTDACDDQALTFDMRGGLVGQIRVWADQCTGCGACVSVCPADAIAVRPADEAAA